VLGNKVSTVKGILKVPYATSSLYTVLTCPNRDEGDAICKPTGNQYDVPYLSEMPLVGNENRPKSILLLACEKD